MSRRSVSVFSTAILLAQLMLLCAGLQHPGRAQTPDPVYDESEVPDYTLPDPLTLSDGTPVESPDTWWNQRRPELLQLFEENLYGRLPPDPPTVRIEQHSVDRSALQGIATRRQVTLHFTEHEDGPQLDLLVYLPSDVDGPVPVFAGLNFAGNHTVQADTAIRLPESWVPDWGDVPSVSGEALDVARGARDRRWPILAILGRGYGVVTAYYGDLFPDREDGFEESVYQLAPDTSLDSMGGEWSALSAWAWGLHRMVDYGIRSDAIDDERIIAVGHSRLGKAALWAGATDRRLAAVVDNASGAGGSALFRRRYGERAIHLDTSFPHWFNETFHTYRENESALPIDQHQLLALIAPRPVLVSPKTGDQWADPKGMFLSARYASPVWTMLGHEGLSVETMPEPDTPVLNRVGFYLRTGKHDLLPADWMCFLDFADRHLSSGPMSE